MTGLLSRKEWRSPWECLLRRVCLHLCLSLFFGLHPALSFFYFTIVLSGFTFRLCSVTSRLIPTMSVGSHAKMHLYFCIWLSSFPLVWECNVEPIMIFWSAYFSCITSFTFDSSSLGRFAPLVISYGAITWLYSIDFFVIALTVAMPVPVGNLIRPWTVDATTPNLSIVVLPRIMLCSDDARIMMKCSSTNFLLALFSSSSVKDRKIVPNSVTLRHANPVHLPGDSSIPSLQLECNCLK